MEDAADALKIAFAVLVFAMGLAVFFNMASLAKNTSDTVFLSIDKSNYYQYSTDIKIQDNRIVKLKDIIPTIYRYNKENYGVTIIDKTGNLIARFDIDTENNAQLWKNLPHITNDKEKIEKFKNDILSYFKKIYTACGFIDKAPQNIETDIFLKVYGENGSNQDFSVEWNGNDESILKRLKMDIFGVDSGLERHKAICNGQGLFKKYNQESEFIEYVLEIDQNEYINEAGNAVNNNIENETVVYLRKQNKMEIIYLEK